jgi:hypothetical protein
MSFWRKSFRVYGSTTEESQGGGVKGIKSVSGSVDKGHRFISAKWTGNKTGCLYGTEDSLSANNNFVIYDISCEACHGGVVL